VLRLELPDDVQEQMKLLKLAALDVGSLDLGCALGLQGEARFFAMWWLRVVGLPTLLLGLGAAHSLFVRWRRELDAEERREEWRDKCFLVLFLTFPNVCNAAFTLLDCRQLDGAGKLEVLSQDYSVSCHSSAYKLHTYVDYAVIAAVVAIPLVFAWQMTRGGDRGEGEGEGVGKGEAVAERGYLVRRITEQLGVARQDAQDLVRETTEHAQFSFLTQGFRPKYAFWETVGTSTAPTCLRARLHPSACLPWLPAWSACLPGLSSIRPPTCLPARPPTHFCLPGYNMPASSFSSLFLCSLCVWQI
jgi:hypothetical protein